MYSVHQDNLHSDGCAAWLETFPMDDVSFNDADSVLPDQSISQVGSPAYKAFPLHSSSAYHSSGLGQFKLSNYTTFGYFVAIPDEKDDFDQEVKDKLKDFKVSKSSKVR